MRRISSDKDTIEHVLGDSLSPAKEAMCLKMWGEGEVGGDGAGHGTQGTCLKTCINDTGGTTRQLQRGHSAKHSYVRRGGRSSCSQQPAGPGLSRDGILPHLEIGHHFPHQDVVNGQLGTGDATNDFRREEVAGVRTRTIVGRY